jgi:hypothetical protein
MRSTDEPPSAPVSELGEFRGEIEIVEQTFPLRPPGITRHRV